MVVSWWIVAFLRCVQYLDDVLVNNCYVKEEETSRFQNDN